MHCPKCGQNQVTEETRFCSRCGFLLTGVAEVVANAGIVPSQQTGLTGETGSAKRRGVKQGAFLFLLTFLVVPILVMISIALSIKPFLPITAMFLFGGGGLLRIVYALMFASGAANTGSIRPGSLGSAAPDREALPPSRSTPASAYAAPLAGSWRDTNELQREPGSVTDTTTKLLHNDRSSDQ